MFKPRIASVALVLLLGTVWLRVSTAADDVLRLIPADVLGVVVVNNPEAAVGKVNELVAGLGLPVPDLAEMLKQQVGEIAGIDRRGSVAVAAVPPDGAGVPTMIAFVPVTDYGKFLESAGAEKVDETLSKGTLAGLPLLIARRGEFALIADPGSAGALAKTIGSPRNLADDLTTLRDRIARADVYAVAPPAGIEFAREQLLAGLAMAKVSIQQQGEAGQQAIAGLEMYEYVVRNLHREITHAAVAATLEDGGAVRVAFSAASAPDSLLARLGGAPESPAIDLLADLPAGDFVVAGGGKLSPDWSGPLADLSLKMMSVYFRDAELNEAQMQETLNTWAETMKNLRSMSMMMGLAAADEPLYANTVMVMKVDNARAYLDAYARSMQQMKEVMKQLENPPFDFSVQRIRVGGVDALRIDLKMDGLVAHPDVPNMEAMFQKMYGSADRMSMYLAARDEHTVVGAYVSQRRLEELLKQEDNLSPLGRDPQVAKTLAMLPAKADGIGLWSVGGTFKYTGQLMGAIEPQMAQMIPAFPDCPPIGMATRLNDRRLDVDLVLPAEVLQAVAGFVQHMQGVQELQ